MTLEQSYVYKRLEKKSHIRLLNLHPGDRSTAIQICLLHADLSQELRYEALSYTWGCPKDMRAISCEEDGILTTLMVTRNCFAALKMLRSPTHERTVWIDAICIDQTNLAERSQQVSLMSQIYTRAEVVIAYLGDSSHESDLGMDFVIQDARSLTERSGHRPSVGLGPESTASPQQTAIDRILSAPYFSRVWVIQEVVFAREVKIILGDKAVDWQDFHRTVFYIGINKKIHLRQHSRLPQILSYREKAISLPSGEIHHWKPESLLELLRDTRTCKATDGRDKIYALLDMAIERSDKILAPNYETSIREVFIKLAIFFIKRDKRLDILSHVQSGKSEHDIPSWVPDWTYPYSCHVLGHEKDSSIRPYKASLQRIANVVFEMDSDGLTVEGKVFDRASTVASRYDVDGEFPSSCLHEWESMVPISVSDPDTAFTDTLLAYPPYVCPSPFRRFYPLWRHRILGHPNMSPNETSGALIFQEQVGKATRGRRFFTTESGRLGLGPRGMVEGDKIAVLLGGSVPFVLRQRGTRYNLVGECYVHGVMNGEMVLDSNYGLEMISII